MSAFVFGAALVSAAAAHDTWIAPDRYAAPAGTRVTIDLTSGMAFPSLDYAIKAERIETARARLAGKSLELKQKGAGPHSLRLPFQADPAGVAAVWIELAPKGLDLDADKVEEYFSEIGATPAIRRVWDEAGAGKAWYEIYSKHAKTYVRIGDPAEDRSWSEPLGMALEIVPQRDPTALHPGDELPILVLKDGKPFVSFPVGLVREGEELGTFQTTDTAGRATFKLDRKGRWLLRGTDLRRAAKAPAGAKASTVAWESDFTTLTLEVR